MSVGVVTGWCRVRVQVRRVGQSMKNDIHIERDGRARINDDTDNHEHGH